MNEIETTIGKIIRKTGRKPVSCKCAMCKEQCRRAPCLGTPQDIWALIEAGYEDKLEVTGWSVGMILGRLPFPIPMVQAILTENGCVFFENGLCILHELGLKPTEGKLSHHTITEENFKFSKNLSWNVAREWIDTRNVATIAKVFQRFIVIK